MNVTGFFLGVHISSEQGSHIEMVTWSCVLRVTDFCRHDTDRGVVASVFANVREKKPELCTKQSDEFSSSLLSFCLRGSRPSQKVVAFTREGV